MRAASDEPTDPPARRRLDDLLRRALRDAQLLAGRPGGGAQRKRREHARGPPRVQQTARPHHQCRRRRRCGVQPEPRPRGRVRSHPRVPDRRPAVERHRLLHAQLRLHPRRAGVRRRAHGRHHRTTDSCARRHPVERNRQFGLGAVGSAPRPSTGRQVRARRSHGVSRGVGHRHRCGACDVQQPDVRPEHVRRCRSRTLKKRSSTSRTHPAIRCSPAPISNGSCRARRSR